MDNTTQKNQKSPLSDILGQGAHSIVYKYTHQNHKSELAMKIGHQSSEKFKKECEILLKLKAQFGFPKIYAHMPQTNCQSSQSKHNWILMERLGQTLKQYLKKPNKQLNMQQVVSLGLQMIERIEILHRKGYLHLDIKPDNFLFGTQRQNCETLYLVDFDMAQENNNSNKNRKINKFKGNLAYSSINAMLCKQSSICDDLEPLIYIIGQMLENGLPWQQYGCKQLSMKPAYRKILRMKHSRNCWKTEKSGWIIEALRICQQEKDQFVYNKLRALIFRLLD